MTEKELQAIRNKPQTITNILDEVFEFKWDGMDYSIDKGETQTRPFFLAEKAAFHMSRKYCVDKWLNFHNEGWKIVDEIMKKEFIEYNKLTKAKAIELAKQRNISLTDENGNDKTKAVLIKDLKASH